MIRLIEDDCSMCDNVYTDDSFWISVGFTKKRINQSSSLCAAIASKNISLVNNKQSQLCRKTHTQSN